MPEWNKPLQTISGETKPFWDFCRQGKLLLQRCDRCNEYQFYPRGICAHCWSNDIKWVQSSGRGTVWTFTVTHQNRTPGFDTGPYVLALVELEEGVKMFTNILECEPGDVKIGMPVEVAWEDMSDDLAIPRFTAAKG